MRLKEYADRAARMRTPLRWIIPTFASLAYLVAGRVHELQFPPIYYVAMSSAAYIFFSELEFFRLRNE